MLFPEKVSAGSRFVWLAFRGRLDMQVLVSFPNVAGREPPRWSRGVWTFRDLRFSEHQARQLARRLRFQL